MRIIFLHREPMAHELETARKEKNLITTRIRQGWTHRQVAEWMGLPIKAIESIVPASQRPVGNYHA